MDSISGERDNNKGFSRPKTPNEWADFWRYDIGVNVIPVDSRKKMPVVKWKEFQDNPVPRWQHEQWKERKMFDKGMAVFPGRVWHREDLSGLFLTIIDCDNAYGIAELCTRNGIRISLSQLAREFMVEQHLDAMDRAHIFFYSCITFPKKGSDVVRPELTEHVKANEIPAIEIKGEGRHGIVCCAPSIHKSGYPYVIIGRPTPPILTESEASALLKQLDSVCRKYGTSYIDSSVSGYPKASTLTPIDQHFLPGAKVYKGHRHLELLRVCEHLILRKRKIKSENKVKVLAEEWNEHHCEPPLEKDEFERQWKDAKMFVAKKLLQEPIFADAEDYSTEFETAACPLDDTKASEQEKIQYLAEQVMAQLRIKTLKDTGEMLYYEEGLYRAGAEDEVYIRLENVGGYSVSVSRRNEVIKHIKYRTMTKREEADGDINIINVANGLLNLMTGELSPHTSDYFSLIRVPVVYDPNARCPRIMEFLKQTLSKKDIGRFERLLGYLLYRTPKYEKAFIFVGPGGNGKSTAIRLIVAFVGSDNCSSVTLQELSNDRFAASDLSGKLVNACADMDKESVIHTGPFRKLVSGDTIRVQRKHQRAFDFQNYAKLVYSTNEIPASLDKSYAYYRRWVILHFDRVFEKNRDTEMAAKLTTPAELSGLLNLAIMGLRKLIEEGGFNDQTAEQIQEQYEYHSTIINQYVRTRCTININNPNLQVATRTLYKDFCAFCKAKKVRRLSFEVFGRQLAGLGVTKMQQTVNRKRERYYMGITFQAASD